VLNYEVQLSFTFNSLGYSYSTFVDASSFLSDNPKRNYDYSVFDAYHLIKKHRCPIIKRTTLWRANYVHSQVVNENKNELITLIEKTGYKTDLIWNNLLRICNIADIYYSLRLNYILDIKHSNLLEKESILIIAYMSYEELIEECLNYLLPLSNIANIIVVTSSEKVYEKIKLFGISVRVIDNYNMNFADLFIICKDLIEQYIYLCFVHDKKVFQRNILPRTHDSYRYLLWENTLASSEYVMNIIQLFKKNNRLGFLGIVSPYHNDYYYTLNNYWVSNFENTISILSELDVNVPISKDIYPISVGTAFWCRTDALQTLHKQSLYKLLQQKSIINNMLELYLPYIAQYNGFYSATVMSSRYASICLLDFKIELNRLNKQSEIYYALKEYMLGFDQLSHIYIYGAGYYGKQASIELNKIGIEYDGFIVSDGQYNQGVYCGHNVYYFSEVELDSETAVILAMKSSKANEVMPKLKQVNVFNFEL